MPRAQLLSNCQFCFSFLSSHFSSYFRAQTVHEIVELLSPEAETCSFLSIKSQLFHACWPPFPHICSFPPLVEKAKHCMFLSTPGLECRLLFLPLQPVRRQKLRYERPGAGNRVPCGLRECTDLQK